MGAYTSGNTSLLDTIVRNYYNNSNDLLATQHISVQVKQLSTVDGAGRNLVTSASQSTTRFKRTAVVKVSMTLNTHNSTGAGAIRTINRVTTIGKFDTHTLNGDGDVEYVTYLGSEHVNDLIIPVNLLEGVYKEGDTL
jgi:hypothetical protein